MDVFVVIVSHGHDELIMENGDLVLLSKIASIVIKDNIESKPLQDFCWRNGFKYISTPSYLGFGANNNVAVFESGVKTGDLLILANPDVTFGANVVAQLLEEVGVSQAAVYGINLFRDKEFTVFDYSVRRFPTLLSLALSFFLNIKRDEIDKSILNAPTEVDWVAGSFLAMKADVFFELDGFDERYFMYCEDIDFCSRAKSLGIPTIFLPDIKATHLAQHKNRSLFSRHFWWHVSSAFKFLVTRYRS